jgi:CheY-like chemotaxis protein
MEAAPRRRFILIVDDQQDTRALVSTYLSMKGFDVLAVEDGSGVMDAVSRRQPDLILLDLMMPGTSGLDVLRSLRAGGSRIPVVIMTALTATESLAEAMAAGAQDSVTKPFSLPRLVDRVQQALLSEVVLEEAVVDDDVIGEDEERVVLAPLTQPPAMVADDEPMHVHERSIEIIMELDAVVQTGDPPIQQVRDLLPSMTRPVGLPSSSSSIFSRLRGLTRRILPEQPRLQAGVTLANRYRLQRALGTGSFGTVWQARHIELDLDVAVKVLHKDARPVRPNETAHQSFRREAVLLARVQSLSCVRATDFGVTDEGHAFLVMELLQGETLRQRLTREGPLSLSVSCGGVADICDALASAHRHGVVHGDVKAANVIVANTADDPPGKATKLIDFGAASSVDEEDVGVVLVGTPSHMSPERFTEPRGTPASDVYAAGIMLFHVLTGSLPYHADAVLDLAKLHRDAPRPRSSAQREGTGAADAILARMCATDPAQRPSAIAASVALRAIARA